MRVRVRVRVRTFALAQLGDLPQGVSHGGDHLVVHVQQRPAGLGEAAVVQQQPVQKQQTLPEQRGRRAAPPRQRGGGAILRGRGRA